MRLFVTIYFVITMLTHYVSAEAASKAQQHEKEGAEYLKNIMNKLQNERDAGTPVDMSMLTNMMEIETTSEDPPFVYHDSVPKGKPKNKYPISSGISGPTPVPIVAEAQPLPDLPPPTELTRDELLAIYHAAIMKGASLPEFQAHQNNVKHGGNSPNSPVIKPEVQGVNGTFPGYYYYFYPIKSFMKLPNNTMSMSTTPEPDPDPEPMKKPEKNYAVEPLFMAISGFVGMALTFAFSVLFLPKFGIFRKVSHDGGMHKLKNTPEDFAAFTRILVESLDGKDCTERVACEIGRIIRTMNMDNKPLKVLEIVLPPYFGKQVAMIRKSATKKEKCNFIPCKFLLSRPAAKDKIKNNKKPSKLTMTPHELWMKHFEKDKDNFKQPENIFKDNNKNKKS